MHDIRRYALHAPVCNGFLRALAKWACQGPIRKSCRPATFRSQAFRTSRCAGVEKSILAPTQARRDAKSRKLPAGNLQQGPIKAPALPPCPARARRHCSSSRSAELSGAGTAASPPVARSLAAPPQSDIRRDVRAPKNASRSNPTMAQRRLTIRLIDCGVSAFFSTESRRPIARRIGPS